MHEDGEVSFHFCLDIQKIIRYNTVFPGILTNVNISNAVGFESLVTLINNAKILKLEVVRKEVSKEKDDTGMHYQGDQNQFPVSLVITKDSESFNSTTASLFPKLKPASSIQQNINGLFGDSKLKAGSMEIGSIRQVMMLAQAFPEGISANPAFYNNLYGLRHYVVSDKSIDREKSEGKVFQYSINIEIEDPFFNYIQQRLEIVKTTKVMMQNYLSFVRAKVIQIIILICLVALLGKSGKKVNLMITHTKH